MATQRKRTGQNNRVSTNYTPLEDKRPNRPGSRRKKKKEETPAKPVATKPQVSNIPPSEGTGGKAETALKYGSGAPKPSPKPSTSPSKPPATASRSTTPKPADKVPSSGSTKPSNQDKSYRGNLFEKTFGYKKGQAPDQRNKAADEAISANRASRAEYNVGQKEGERRLQNGKEVQLATAQRDKARPKQGPANPAEPAKPASPASPNEPRKYAQASKGMTLAERMRRRRMGLS